MNINPKKISKEEWKEIGNVRIVYESWGLNTQEERDNFITYGAKYDYITGCPGYCGDLFVIVGDALDVNMTLVLYRDRDGKLNEV